MASQLESFSKWLQLKIYQLEVTMSVYIYTPIEKFIFCTSCPLSSRQPACAPPLMTNTRTNTPTQPPDSVLFLLFSLTFIATVLYLPQHLQFIISRAWFYMHGDAFEAAAAAGGAVSSALGTGAAAAAKATVDVVREL